MKTFILLAAVYSSLPSLDHPWRRVEAFTDKTICDSVARHIESQSERGRAYVAKCVPQESLAEPDKLVDGLQPFLGRRP